MAELTAGLVASIRYKPGWTFKLAGPLGRKLCIFATTPDSMRPGHDRVTQHQFDLPDFTVDPRSPERFVFDCLVLCERHEVGEFLQLGPSRPFYPYHADEGSPYVVVDRSEQRCP